MEERGRSGNSCFDEGTFTAVLNASVRLAVSLPSLVFGKILRAYGITPILPGRRGRSESRRIPGEGGCSTRVLLSSGEPALSFITTQLTQSDGDCGPEEVTGCSRIFKQASPLVSEK